MDIESITGVFQRFEFELRSAIEYSIDALLLNIYLQGYEAFAPILLFYVVSLGVGLYMGKIELTFKEFFTHIFSLWVILALGLNYNGYTEWVKGFFDSLPNDMIQVISPTYTSFSGELDKQMGEFATLNEKVKAGDGYFWPYALSFITTVFSLIYSVYLFGVYIIAKIASGVLIVLGPLAFLTLLSQKLQRILEMWFMQLMNYQLLTVLLIALMSILNGFMALAIQRIDQNKGIYNLNDVWPVYAAMGVTIFLVSEMKNIAAALTGSMSQAPTNAIPKLANIVQNSVSIFRNGRFASRVAPKARGQRQNLNTIRG